MKPWELYEEIKKTEYTKSGDSVDWAVKVYPDEKLIRLLFEESTEDRDWRNNFEEQYLRWIRFICIAMSDEYIDSHFEEIKSHASDIETRLDDSYCTAEQMKQDNHQVIDGYRSNGEQITLITENYDDSIREVFD